MYGPGQIVYDLNKKEPARIGDNVWDKASYPARSTHFIKEAFPEPKMIPNQAPGGLFYTAYEIACPKTLEEARDLLEKGIIQPAPARTSDHCWKCQNWKSNCKSFKKCSEGKNW